MQSSEQNTKPVHSAGYRNYQGGYFKVLVDTKDTGDTMAIVDFTLPRGAEPPPHYHQNEDETFYLLEGNMRFQIGDRIVKAGPGDAVFAPRAIVHHFTIENEQARFINVITPGKLLSYFIEFSIPSEGELVVTPPQGPPPPEAIAYMVGRLKEQYGIVMP